MRALLLTTAAFAFLTVLFSFPAHAGNELKLQGTVFSITSQEFVFQTDHTLIHLKKGELSPEQRHALDVAQAHEISISVPMSAISRVRPPSALKAFTPVSSSQ